MKSGALPGGDLPRPRSWLRGATAGAPATSFTAVGLLSAAAGSTVAISALVVTGWLLRDLAFVAASREPYLALRLVPGAAGAVLLGTLVGLSCAVYAKAFRVLLVTAGILSIVSGLGRLGIDPGWVSLPKAFLLLLCGAGVARRLVTSAGFEPVRTSHAIGVALSATTALYRFGALTTNGLLLACAVGVVLAEMGQRARRFAWLASLATIVVYVGVRARSQLELRRPDEFLTTGAAVPDAPNLVLIVLDTVSADHLAPYGYSRLTTPGLDQFVREHAVTYTDARSASSWTLPAHASLFTGLLPSEHGATYPRNAPNDETVFVARWPAQPLAPEMTTLAELLVARGYQTAAIVANSAYLAHQFRLDQGFQHYDDRPSAQFSGRVSLVQYMGLQPEIGLLPYRDAATITRLALRWLDDHTHQEGRPFFLFLNYMDAHEPYVPPSPFDRMFDEERPVDARWPPRRLWSLLYDRELRYLDYHLTRLLRNLEERESFDNTIVIITSDHGEAFGEHGFWGHDQSLYEEVLRVPLYVKPTGRKRTDRVMTPISGTGVNFLVLEQLRVLRDDRRPEAPVIAEWHWNRARRDNSPRVQRDLVAWLEGRRKFIVGSQGELETFDLETDPKERRNLGASEKVNAEALGRAARWWNTHPLIERPPENPIEPALVERLRALGYLQ